MSKNFNKIIIYVLLVLIAIIVSFPMVSVNFIKNLSRYICFPNYIFTPKCNL